MNLYTVGHSSFGEGGRVNLVHEQLFGNEAWREMLFDCIKIASAEQYDSEKRAWEEGERPNFLTMAADCLKVGDERSAAQYTWEAQPENMHVDVSFAQIYERVGTLMCELYGFKRIEYTNQTFLFGLDNFCNTEGYSESRVLDPFMAEISDYVRSEIHENKTSPDFEELPTVDESQLSPDDQLLLAFGL